MENQKQETTLKLSKSQVQNIINTHIQEEHGLNDLFAMMVNGLMLSERNAFLNEDETEGFEQLQDFEGFEKIYVFSRDGDIKELPRGSTVLDFAYHVHTEVGNKCYAARVNQRYVPLTYTLKTGEQV